MQLVDTHCHIHFDKFPIDPQTAIKNAEENRVNKLICVGTTVEDSQKAAAFADGRPNVWASAGVHPHDAANFLENPGAKTRFKKLLNKSSIIAIGEIGLDYYKNYSPKPAQQQALRLQIEAGLPTGLPFIFHVRDSWEDFWEIYDSYHGLPGVIHSFSATQKELGQALERGMYIGLNGIMTFTKDQRQLAAAKEVPPGRLLLETDAPFLAPKPFRGQTCEPKHIMNIAEFLANLRGEELGQLAEASTANAVHLFKL